MTSSFVVAPQMAIAALDHALLRVPATFFAALASAHSLNHYLLSIPWPLLPALPQLPGPLIPPPSPSTPHRSLNTRFTPLPHIYPFPSLRPLKPHNFDPCLSNSHLAPPIQLCKSCPISAFICPRPHLSLNCLLITHITPWHA